MNETNTETDITDEELKEIITTYREVKRVLDEITDYLKFFILIIFIGIWTYVILSISAVISSLGLISGLLLGLVTILFIAIGILLAILKLRDL